MVWITVNRWRWALIVTLGTALGCFASLSLSDVMTRYLPNTVAVTVAIILLTMVLQFIVIGIVAGCYGYMIRLRARRLLRRFVSAEQYAEYRRTGHVTEQIGEWKAIVSKLGIAWQHPSVNEWRSVVIDGGRVTGLWECIMPGKELCPEDGIISELLHARQAAFPAKFEQDSMYYVRRHDGRWRRC